jgi:hypothetical protein
VLLLRGCQVDRALFCRLGLLEPQLRNKLQKCGGGFARTQVMVLDSDMMAVTAGLRAWISLKKNRQGLYIYNYRTFERKFAPTFARSVLEGLVVAKVWLVC